MTETNEAKAGEGPQKKLATILEELASTSVDGVEGHYSRLIFRGGVNPDEEHREARDIIVPEVEISFHNPEERDAALHAMSEAIGERVVPTATRLARNHRAGMSRTAQLVVLIQGTAAKSLEQFCETNDIGTSWELARSSGVFADNEFRGRAL